MKRGLAGTFQPARQQTSPPVQRYEAVPAELGDSGGSVHIHSGFVVVLRYRAVEALIAAEAGIIYPQLVAVYDRHAADRLHIASIPRALVHRSGYDRIAAGTREIVAVAAVHRYQLGYLRNAPVAAEIVLGAVVNLKHSQHDALISDRVHIVKLRLHADVGIRQIVLVGAKPLCGGLWIPVRALEQIIAFVVLTRARRPAAPNRIDPFFAERIVEHRRAVAHISGQRKILPAYAVRRASDYARIVSARIAQVHLISARGVWIVIVNPEGCRIGTQIMRRIALLRAGGAIIRQNAVGAVAEVGTLPFDSVAGDRVAHLIEPAGFVPHLIDALILVEPDSARLRTGDRRNALPLPFCLGTQHRIALKLHRRMIFGRKSGFVDEKIVHEQLTSHRDVYHLRRIFEIRQVGRIGRL